MKTKYFLAAVAGVLVAASAYAIPIVNFTESADGSGINVLVTFSGWSSAPTISGLSPETASLAALDGPVPGGGQRYIAYWEDTIGGILSDYVQILVQGQFWKVNFYSDPGTGPFGLPAGVTADYNLIETAGLMLQNVTIGSSTITVGVDSGVDAVPDGGLTAMLLGMGMLGLGWVRRMVK